MKLSEVNIIADAKKEYDRTIKEIKSFENMYNDFEVKIGTTALFTHKQSPNGLQLRAAITKCLCDYKEQLVTKLAMLGVHDFEN